MSRANFNLVNLMNQFYQQIATIKVWIAQDRLALEAKSILKLQEMPGEVDIATAMSMTLSQWLAQKRLYWRHRLTDRQLSLLDKACFAMSALADELFILELDWAGREYWDKVLLEEHFYQSCSAGGTFFRDVDALLDSSKHDSLEIQLAAVYLMALRLGFAGKYRDSEQKLTEYRSRLFKIVSQNQSTSEELVHEQAYEHCLVSPHEQRLAPISNWYRVTFYGTCAYLVIGILAWFIINQGVDKWLTS